jgi:hypothetical protein
MVGHKLIFKIKLIFDGMIVKCKAKLVANLGYIQRKGIDYQKTFSPVVKFISNKNFSFSSTSWHTYFYVC